MEIIKLSAIILIAVVLVNSIPTYSKEITILITFSCCIVVLLYILDCVTPAIEYVKNLAEKIAFDGIDVVLKAVGVGFITQFVSDIALDCNNKSLSNQMIFAGRICVLMLGLPIFLQVFDIIDYLISRV